MTRSQEKNAAFSLNGRRAVVTGASSGIGAAITRALGGAGADVVAVGRNQMRLERVANDVAKLGVRCVRVVSDVSSEGSAQTIIDSAVAELGGIDILVPCAGIYEPEQLDHGTVAAFDRHIAVNLRAPYELIIRALSHLEAGASIILISSIAGLVGIPESPSYCASKGAIEAMTKSFALALGPRGIRVNAIAPGFIDTAIDPELQTSPEAQAQLIDATPLARIAHPDEIGPAAVFLAANASSFVHGATLTVDGGWTAQ